MTRTEFQQYKARFDAVRVALAERGETLPDDLIARRATIDGLVFDLVVTDVPPEQWPPELEAELSRLVQDAERLLTSSPALSFSPVLSLAAGGAVGAALGFLFFR